MAKPKGKSQAELRAEEEAARHEQAKKIYEDIWTSFAKDRKTGPAKAYTNLLGNLTKFSGFLVPELMTAKEHMNLIAEAESKMTDDGHGNIDDPRQLVGAWLRGEVDLSRISLEKQKL
jgi:hypothetical protein